MYIVYIIQSKKDESYYVGQTADLKDRLQRHNQGRSKFTKTRIPWELVYRESFKKRGEAVKREIEIKKRKSKRYIESLINIAG